MNVVGSVKLQVFEAETGELVHEQEEQNICVAQIFNATVGLLSFGVPAILSGYVWVGPNRLIKNPNFDGNCEIGGIYAYSDTAGSLTRFSKTLATPYYHEYSASFATPPSNRTIYSVGLTNSSSGTSDSPSDKAAYPSTIVNLSVPCTQTTTQILVVVYRIQVLLSPIIAGTIPVSSSIDRAMLGSLAGAEYGGDGINSQVFSCTRQPNLNAQISSSTKLLPAAKMGTLVTTTQAGIADNNTRNTVGFLENSNRSWISGVFTNNYKYGGIKLAKATASGFDVGTLYGTFMPGYTAFGNGNAHISVFNFPVTRQGWEPVQTIFKHATTGTQPFQELTALATGSGNVTATAAGTWTQPDWPEYYNVKIIGGGATGVARYVFSKRALSGFSRSQSTSPTTGSSYTSQYYIPQVMPNTYTSVANSAGSIIKSSTTATSTGSNFNINVHPLYAESIANRHEIYDKTSVVSWNTTGFTIFDLVNSDVFTFDSSSSPALPVTGVRQCAVDNSGNVWVACALTGLWKVTNPKGVATVTNYTSFTNILPLPVSLATTNAYAVQVGYSNNVFAMLNGGLVRTSDSGATWYIYNPTSTPAFSFTGITDSNWSRVYTLRVQKTSPTFRMGMVYGTIAGDSTTAASIAWWSILGTAYGGTSIVGYAGTAATQFDVSLSNHFGVADSGDLWVVSTTIGGISASTRLRSLVWGTGYYWQHTQNIPTDNAQAFQSTGFLYDSYGTPYIEGGTHPAAAAETDGWRLFYPIGAGSPGGMSSLAPGAAGAPCEEWGRTFNAWTYSYYGSKQINNFGTGMTLQMLQGSGTSSQTGSYTLVGRTITPNFAYNLGGASFRMQYNESWSPYEEFVWEHYLWNGAAWVKEYHVAAADTAGAPGGPWNGTRFRFEPESYFFTGRSTIVIPDGVSGPLPTYFVNDLTFAVRTVPQATLADQNAQLQLFSWIDKTNNHQLQLLLNNSNSRTWSAGNAALKVYSPTTPFTYTINGVNIGSKIWTVAGNHASRFKAGDLITVSGNPAGNGVYGVVSAANNLTNTDITVIETIPGGSTGVGTVSARAAYLNFGTMPSLSSSDGYSNTSAHNIAFVISGTSASLYVDGVQSGLTVTVPVAFNFASTNAEAVIGGNRVNIVDGIGFNRATAFYRGTMQHIVLDSSAWAVGDVVNHQAAPTTYTTATTRVVYDLTASLAGLESKATHTAYDTLFNGITIKFADGAIAPHFVTQEYYTFGVYDGILKDNATSFNNTMYYTMFSVTPSFSTTDLATIPGTGTSVTEPYVPRRYTNAANLYFIPGYSNPSATQSSSPFIGFQSTTGNLELECTPDESTLWSSNRSGLTNAFVWLGLNDATNTFPGIGTQPKWALKFKVNNGTLGTACSIDVIYNDATAASNVTTWVWGDVIKLVRSGGTLVAQKNGVTFHTFASPPGGGIRLWPCTKHQAGSVGGGNFTYPVTLGNVKLTWTRDAYTVALGNQIAQTGKWDPYFFNFDGTSAQQITVNIAGYGTAAGVYIFEDTSYTSTIDQLPTPGLNECVFVPDAGFLKFNPGDVGKAITVSSTLIKRSTI